MGRWCGYAARSHGPARRTPTRVAAAGARGQTRAQYTRGARKSLAASWSRAAATQLPRHTRSCDNVYRARESTLAGRAARAPPSTRRSDGMADPKIRDGARAASLNLVDESQQQGMTTRAARTPRRARLSIGCVSVRDIASVPQSSLIAHRVIAELAKIAPTRANQPTDV